MLAGVSCRPRRRLLGAIGVREGSARAGLVGDVAGPSEMGLRLLGASRPVEELAVTECVVFVLGCQRDRFLDAWAPRDGGVESQAVAIVTPCREQRTG